MQKMFAWLFSLAFALNFRLRALARDLSAEFFVS